MGFFDFLWGKKRQNDDGGTAASGAIFVPGTQDENEADTSTDSPTNSFSAGDASGGGGGDGGGV